ncbi:hypothetical protein GCM10011515_13780 [Tsuneonella deserti]|uniref:Gcp-like domain-containing protein n=2 Tax=Tsuneonella deserti TaxID=2035528 RepID=A0ABQ1S7V7_9SPHN|nr:hypothetical protein GCM10011515_13780 [Tsuneonella deserti]
MIAGLPGKGRADRILVSLGPGSFTGVRIGIATARALGLAWQAPVLGYPTLALVAAMALAGRDLSGVTVCMTGGHGEWFVQDFGPGPVLLGPVQSLVPEAAAGRNGRLPLAGSQATALAERRGDHSWAGITLPDAAQAGLLPTGILSETISPIYGRGPDARLPG